MTRVRDDSATPAGPKTDRDWQYVRPSGIRLFALGWACSLEIGLFPLLVAMVSGMFIGVAIFDLVYLVLGLRQIRSAADLPLGVVWQLAVVSYFPLVSWLIALAWRRSGKLVPGWNGTWEIALAARSGKHSKSGRAFGLPPTVNRAGVSLSDRTRLGYGSPPSIMCLLSAPAFFLLVLIAKWLADAV